MTGSKIGADIMRPLPSAYSLLYLARIMSVLGLVSQDTYETVLVCHYHWLQRWMSRHEA